MEVKHSYKRRGTPDLPMAVYIAQAGVNIHHYVNADRHKETEISLLVSGAVTLQMGDRVFVCKPGDILIIPPHTPHQRSSFSDETKIHTVVFSTNAIRMHNTHFFQKEFVKPLEEGRLEFPTLLQPGHPAYDQVYSLMLQLEKGRIYEKNYRQWRLHLLMGICLALMPHCKILTDERPIPDPGHEAVKLCMRYIHNNYRSKITLQKIADHCHLHPNYLCAVFKQYTGQTVLGYLTKIRVETAAGLLQQEDLSIGEVAELSGFQSQGQFFKKFKEIMGTTPGAYVKK